MKKVKKLKKAKKGSLVKLVIAAVLIANRNKKWSWMRLLILQLLLAG